MFLCIILKGSFMRLQRAQDHRNQSPDEKYIEVFVSQLGARPPGQPRPAPRLVGSAGWPAPWPAQACSQAGSAGWLAPWPAQTGSQAGRLCWVASPLACLGRPPGRAPVPLQRSLFQGPYLRGFFPNGSLRSFELFFLSLSPPLLQELKSYRSPNSSTQTR